MDNYNCYTGQPKKVEHASATDEEERLLAVTTAKVDTNLGEKLCKIFFVSIMIIFEVHLDQKIQTRGNLNSSLSCQRPHKK